MRKLRNPTWGLFTRWTAKDCPPDPVVLLCLAQFVKKRIDLSKLDNDDAMVGVRWRDFFGSGAQLCEFHYLLEEFPELSLSRVLSIAHLLVPDSSPPHQCPNNPVSKKKHIYGSTRF